MTRATITGDRRHAERLDIDDDPERLGRGKWKVTVGGLETAMQLATGTQPDDDRVGLTTFRDGGASA